MARRRIETRSQGAPSASPPHRNPLPGSAIGFAAAPNIDPEDWIQASTARLGRTVPDREFLRDATSHELLALFADRVNEDHDALLTLDSGASAEAKEKAAKEAADKAANNGSG